MHQIHIIQIIPAGVGKGLDWSCSIERQVVIHAARIQLALSALRKTAHLREYSLSAVSHVLCPGTHVCPCSSLRTTATPGHQSPHPSEVQTDIGAYTQACSALGFIHRPCVRVCPHFPSCCYTFPILPACPRSQRTCYSLQLLARVKPLPR